MYDISSLRVKEEKWRSIFLHTNSWCKERVFPTDKHICRADLPVRVISCWISIEKGRQGRASHCIWNTARHGDKGQLGRWRCCFSSQPNKYIYNIQPGVALPYRRFNTTYRSHLQGSRDSLTLEDGKDRLSRNVGRGVIIPYRRFGTTYHFSLQGSKYFFILEDRSEWLSRNVGRELPPFAA
jgi:hypothetical protein